MSQLRGRRPGTFSPSLAHALGVSRLLGSALPPLDDFPSNFCLLVHILLIPDYNSSTININTYCTCRDLNLLCVLELCRLRGYLYSCIAPDDPGQDIILTVL